MSYAAISTAMTDAVTALGNGDYALARDKALAAQALSSILPDLTRNSSGGGSQSATWDRVAISVFLDRVQRILNSSAGVQTSKAVLQHVDAQGVSQQLGSF